MRKLHNKRPKSKLVKLVKAVAARRVKRKNPEEPGPLLPEMGILTDIAAASAAFTISVMVDRIAVNLLARKFAWAPRISPLLRGGVFGLMWVMTNKWQAAKRYRDAMLVGAGVAIVHAIVQKWLPGLAFLTLGDAQAPIAIPSARRGVGGQDFAEPEEQEVLDYLDGHDEDSDLYQGSLARN